VDAQGSKIADWLNAARFQDGDEIDGRNRLLFAASGDDLIRISGGNDIILHGKGDGYDVVTDSSNLPTEHDTLILTDINSGDVVLSRVASDLILTVKSTGEYIDFTNFYPTNTGDWDSTARNIDTIRFADGETWNRSEIQEKAWP
jgi:hypothetical protein